MPEVCCPRCGSSAGQVKAGINGGSQQYRCGACRRRYVPEPKRRGYPDSLRTRAATLRAEGWTLARIGETLGVTPRTLRNWFQQGSSNEATQTDTAGATNASGNLQSPTPDTARNPREWTADLAGDGLTPAAPPAVRRRVTIHDVAERAGVAPSTVSNYINDKGRMNAGTRERIKTVIDALNFTPNSLVRAVRQGRTNILGVVSFGLFDLGDAPSDSIVSKLLGGINRGANSRGYNVMLYTGWPDRMAASSGREFLDAQIDGLIWIGPSLKTPQLEYVARSGLPVMSLLSPQFFPGAGFVAADNQSGIRQVVAHLASLGHRRIAYAGPVHTQDYVDRLRGYKSGLKECGLDWDQDLVAAGAAMSRNWFQSFTGNYEAALDKWLSLEKPPTAIVLATDHWADWIITEITKRGLKTPDDISVTGFDNIVEPRQPNFTLTTVRQDFREIGRLGAFRLVDLIEGMPAEQCRIILPVELVVGTSTGKARGDN